MRRARGLWANCPSPSSPPRPKQGKGKGGSPTTAWPAARGSGAALEKGRRRREARGADSRSQLGQRRSGVAWPRRPVSSRWRRAWGRRCKACRQPGLGGKGKGSLGGSIAYLGLGWGAAGRGVPRWPASWGGGNGGRRRWELGRRLGVAVEVMEVKGDTRAPFIGEIRRRGEPWGGSRGAVGRRAPRAPLMAIGTATARFATAQG